MPFLCDHRNVRHHCDNCLGYAFHARLATKVCVVHVEGHQPRAGRPCRASHGGGRGGGRLRRHPGSCRCRRSLPTLWGLVGAVLEVPERLVVAATPASRHEAVPADELWGNADQVTCAVLVHAAVALAFAQRLADARLPRRVVEERHFRLLLIVVIVVIIVMIKSLRLGHLLHHTLPLDQARAGRPCASGRAGISGHGETTREEQQRPTSR
mmetsp:Transcript_28903/g.54206  ORF Transcript_28903/g.54206 Transcript_28903/m.54206 type:complete len:211 (+) Transcript_28903:689-1321(+)